MTTWKDVLYLYNNGQQIFRRKSMGAVLNALILLDSKRTNFPKIVCLCGSTRFGDTFKEANLIETLAGHIVLSIGCNMRDDIIFATFSEVERASIKNDLDILHKRKIDLADEILVLNVGGYIGKSTQSEIEYAKTSGKVIRYLEPVDL